MHWPTAGCLHISVYDKNYTPPLCSLSLNLTGTSSMVSGVRRDVKLWRYTYVFEPENEKWIYDGCIVNENNNRVYNSSVIRLYEPTHVNPTRRLRNEQPWQNCTTTTTTLAPHWVRLISVTFTCRTYAHHSIIVHNTLSLLLSIGASSPRLCMCWIIL